MQKLLLISALITIPAYTWCAQLTQPAATTAAAVAEQIKTAAAMLAAPKDKFEDIKKLISKNTQAFLYPDDHAEMTTCGDTFIAFMHLLFGFQKDYTLIPSIKAKELATFDDEIDNEHGTLVAELGTIQFDETFYNHSFFDRLFSTEDRSENLLFFIILRKTPYKETSYHALCVEKYYDGQHAPWFRIYNSWCDGFTLREWLGMSSTDDVDEHYKRYIKRYGNGKKLSKKDIWKFFGNLANKNPLYYYMGVCNLETDPADAS